MVWFGTVTESACHFGVGCSVMRVGSVQLCVMCRESVLSVVLLLVFVLLRVCELVSSSPAPAPPALARTSAEGRPAVWWDGLGSVLAALCQLFLHPCWPSTSAYRLGPGCDSPTCSVRRPVGTSATNGVALPHHLTPGARISITGWRDRRGGSGAAPAERGRPSCAAFRRTHRITRSSRNPVAWPTISLLKLRRELSIGNGPDRPDPGVTPAPDLWSVPAEQQCRVLPGSPVVRFAV